jgi:hypothetical protein
MLCAAAEITTADSTQQPCHSLEALRQHGTHHLQAARDQLALLQQQLCHMRPLLLLAQMFQDEQAEQQRIRSNLLPWQQRGTSSSLGGPDEAAKASEATVEANLAHAQLQRRLSQVLHGRARSSDGEAEAAPVQRSQQRKHDKPQQLPWRLTDSSASSEDAGTARGRLSMSRMLSGDSSDDEGASHGAAQQVRQQPEQQAHAGSTAGTGHALAPAARRLQEQGHSQAAGSHVPGLAAAPAQQQGGLAAPAVTLSQHSTAELAAALEQSMSQLQEVQQLSAALQASMLHVEEQLADSQVAAAGARQRGAASALQVQVQQAAAAAAQASCDVAAAKAQKAGAAAASAVQQLRQVQQLKQQLTDKLYRQASSGSTQAGHGQDAAGSTSSRAASDAGSCTGSNLCSHQPQDQVLARLSGVDSMAADMAAEISSLQSAAAQLQQEHQAALQHQQQQGALLAAAQQAQQACQHAQQQREEQVQAQQAHLLKLQEEAQQLQAAQQLLQAAVQQQRAQLEAHAAQQAAAAATQQELEAQAAAGSSSADGPEPGDMLQQVPGGPADARQQHLLHAPSASSAGPACMRDSYAGTAGLAGSTGSPPHLTAQPGSAALSRAASATGTQAGLILSHPSVQGQAQDPLSRALSCNLASCSRLSGASSRQHVLAPPALDAVPSRSAAPASVPLSRLASASCAAAQPSGSFPASRTTSWGMGAAAMPGSHLAATLAERTYCGELYTDASEGFGTEHSRSSTAMGVHLRSSLEAVALRQELQPAASVSSSSRLALDRQPRSLPEACQLFAAKKLARRVLHARRKAVAARAELRAIALQHSRRSTQRAVLRRLAIWQAGQQQLASLLRSLVCLRLAVRHWHRHCQRRRSKRAMQQQAGLHWQHHLARQAFAMWHGWTAARHHAGKAHIRRCWRQWRSGILARALLTRVFTTMQQCWAARQHQRELCWAAVAAGMAPPAGAAATEGRYSSMGEARGKCFAGQYRVLAVSFAGWRLWLRACLAKRHADARMEMAASYRRTTLLLQGLR